MSARSGLCPMCGEPVQPGSLCCTQDVCCDDFDEWVAALERDEQYVTYQESRLRLIFDAEQEYNTGAMQ